MIAQTRAQAQAAVGGEKAVDAFKDFSDLVNRQELDDRQEKMRKNLEDMKSIKEIRFRPLNMAQKTRTLRSVRRDDLPRR